MYGFGDSTITGIESVEARPESDPGLQPVVIEGRDANEIGFHVGLLHNGGFIEAKRIHNKGWQARRLTWLGCDYLDALRSREKVDSADAPDQKWGSDMFHFK